MKPFTQLTARAVPIDDINIDTDRVIPARFLPKPRSEFGKYLLHDMRHRPDGEPNPDFPLNDARRQGAEIIVANDNFGCGSSREAAVWAVAGFGFRALIAPSFGDIFFNNCCKNGVLPVVLPADVVAELRARVHADPSCEITIDLESCQVSCGDIQAPFEMEEMARWKLLKGVDDIDLTLESADAIASYEARRAAEWPWRAP